MGAFTRLMSRLHSVFNKDPLRTPVAAVASDDTTVTVYAMQMIVVVADNRQVFPISTATLTEVVASVNAAYSTVVLSISDVTYSDRLARGLYESELIPTGAYIEYPTSLLWAEMQTYGWEIDLQAEQLRLAGQQLFLHTSEGTWLDKWCKDYFGMARLDDETDDQYRKRVVHDICTPNQNNKAMEIMIKEGMTGFDCDIIDSAIAHNNTDWCCYFQAIVGIDLESQEPLAFDETKVKAIIARNKAAGTELEVYGAYGRLTDAVVTTDELLIYDLDISPTDLVNATPAYRDGRYVRNAQVTYSEGYPCFDSLKLDIYVNGQLHHGDLVELVTQP